MVRGREFVFGFGLSSRYDEDRGKVRVVERQINPSEIPDPNSLNKLYVVLRSHTQFSLACRRTLNAPNAPLNGKLQDHMTPNL